MKSPFKFLDAYTAEDRDVFLGREEEIAALYDMVLKNRLILVYGQSGTGKTSLIQCGLASRFDATDWLPLFVRRQNDLNRSLEQQLGKLINKTTISSPAEAVAEIYLEYLRPVYLVFDQLEELFILGSTAEQKDFVNSIRLLLDSGTPCRIMFVIREEYLAYLYGFERVIPTLFDRRLRVEPMGVSKVQQVLEGSFARFNVQVQAPVAETYGQIIDNISGGKAGIQLPYLQVYLDLLYREDFARTYPGEEAGTAGIWKPVEITRDEIQVLGKMDNVLEKFLREQQEFLQKELLKTNAQADPEAIRKVLDAFVSEEGTKRPISFERKAERLVLDGKMAAFFQPLSPELTSTICISLEKARLLRFGDSHIELAHDALAAIVDGQRSAQQRSLRDALNRLNSAYREHEATGEYLSRRQLNSLEALMPLLTPRISQDIKGFMAASEEHALALEQAELVAERKKRQTARRFAAAGFALAMLAMAGFYAASLQYRAAAQNAAEARLNFAHTLKVEGKYDAALDQLEDIRFKSVLRNTQLEQVAKTKDMWQKIKNYIQEGDKMAAVDDFPKAIESYRQAAQIENDAHIDNLINQTTKDLETTYSEAIRDGQLLMSTRGGIERAIQKFELAGRMKPGDGTASRLLQESKAKRN